MMSAVFQSRGRWLAALSVFLMSFSYGMGSNPQIDYPRLLIADTINTPTQPCIFQDQEIMAMENIVSSVWQSSQFWSGTSGQPVLPSSPVNYLRTAAYLLNAIASNQALLSSVQQLLDVKIDASKAAAALQKQAQTWMDIDDNSMAFVIIEQVNDSWSFRDRFWTQWQRTASQ
jgi:hypothetical protein